MVRTAGRRNSSRGTSFRQFLCRWMQRITTLLTSIWTMLRASPRWLHQRTLLCPASSSISPWWRVTWNDALSSNHSPWTRGNLFSDQSNSSSAATSARGLDHVFFWNDWTW